MCSFWKSPGLLVQNPPDDSLGIFLAFLSGNAPEVSFANPSLVSCENLPQVSSRSPHGFLMEISQNLFLGNPPEVPSENVGILQKFFAGDLSRKPPYVHCGNTPGKTPGLFVSILSGFFLFWETSRSFFLWIFHKFYHAFLQEFRIKFLNRIPRSQTKLLQESLLKFLKEKSPDEIQKQKWR